MSKVIGLSAIVLLSLVSVPALAVETNPKLIKEYHPMERSRTLLIQEDRILVGRTGTTEEGSNFVEVFDVSSHALLHSLRVPHVLRGLQAMDSDCKVLAFGVRGYSTIDFCRENNPVVRTFSFNANFLPHQGTHLGSGRGVLFSEPNAGMIVYSGSSPREHIQDHVSYTVSMNYFYDSVWIANYSNLNRLDPESGELTAIFDGSSYGWKNAAPAQNKDGTEAIVATARDDSLIAVLDREGAVQTIITAKGDPEGIATFGNCAAIADSSLKQIVFVEVNGVESKILLAWDASTAGDRLKYPAEIAIHPESRQVFLRSSYPCPTCSVTQSSLFALTAPDSTVIDSCLGL